MDQIFLASEKQLRPNRNGNLYLQLELSDRSGVISARMWNASEQDYRNFENGDYVRVEGTTQLFQGTIQLIATTIRKAPKSDVNPDDFMILGSKEIDQLVTRLTTHLRKLRDPHLLNLAECFLVDDEFMRKFSRAPAGVKNHHAYVGGLIEHVALPGPEFLKGPGDQVPLGRRARGVCLDHVVGRVDPVDRCADHDP